MFTLRYGRIGRGRIGLINQLGRIRLASLSIGLTDLLWRIGLISWLRIRLVGWLRIIGLGRGRSG